MVLQPHLKKPTKRPSSPNFSCGPTKKPDGWNPSKLNLKNISRYHRSDSAEKYMTSIVNKLRLQLKIPKSYSIFLTPGSCTGAMESVIWSLLRKKRVVTSVVYDFWGLEWVKDLEKLNLDQDVRLSLNGTMPDLSKINKNNDIIFVWTGTTTGMSINNLNWINDNHEGLVICDANSSIFIYDHLWPKIDVTVFSWQKALGSESQHGIVVMSPKAIERLNTASFQSIPKILDLKNYRFPINTPSLLCFSDFEFCLNWFNNNGGINWSNKICLENKTVLDQWASDNEFISHFCTDKNFRSLSPCFFKLDNISIKKFEKIILFLKKEKIAFDIESYSKSEKGFRIWTGPTILKKDLITLTNWLDWTFYNID